MRAIKGNKEYSISEAQKKGYQDCGFDILDDDGKIIAYGRGKTVPYEDFLALKAEMEKLKATAETEAQKAERKSTEKKTGE